MRQKPIIGTTFGQYTIISDQIKVIDNKSYYLVKCRCGRENYIRSDILKRGEATKCRYCANKINYERNVERGLIDYVGYSEGKHRGCGDLSKTFYSQIKRNAKKRNIYWSDDLTIEYLWDLYLKQDKKCALTGLEISLRKDQHTPINNAKSNIDYTTFTASLDRIDSYKGYEIGNVQWVHRNINIMKNSFSQNYFIQMCNLVSKNNQQLDFELKHESSKKSSEIKDLPPSNG